MDGTDDQVESIAALGEPVRRSLYRFVVGARRPVSREEAADGVGVALHVAKFHLDRLVQDGLLETEYSRPPGRTGPGAGRPAKLYRRTDREVAVSLPGRNYELAAQVLAAAVATNARTSTPLDRALRTAATEAGRRLAGAGNEDAIDILARNGYEPYATDTGIELGNCPFHSLAADHTELVCGLNLDLLRAMVRRLDDRTLRARLDPGPGRCCVTLVRS